jgi:hypothetical protein
VIDRREQVVDLLQLRFADDSLSLDEFERRIAIAYQARTATELDSLVADLSQETAVTMIPEYGRIVTILSNNERGSSMPVPRHLDILSIMGNVEMDMSGATFAPGVTEIDISAFLGNVQITVPLGIRVESSGDALLGNFDCKVPNVAGYPDDRDRVLRIKGRAVLSSIEIDAAPSRVLHPGDVPGRLS